MKTITDEEYKALIDAAEQLNDIIGAADNGQPYSTEELLDGKTFNGCTISIDELKPT